jgi:cytoskeletal protein RodZ
MKKQNLQAHQLQATALAKVGLILMQTREQRDFSLDDLAIKTHIPARLLQAIEQGEMTPLPEPVYIQSFIRQYANVMGLNGVQLASEFPVEPVIRPLRPPLFGRPNWQLRPVHLYAAYTVVILGAVQGLSLTLNRSASQLSPQSAALQSSPIASSPGAGPSAGSSAGPVLPSVVLTPITGENRPKAVRVALTLTDASWVKVVVDGKPEFEGTMDPGAKRLLTANQRVTVTAGNAGGVVATFNGGEAKPLGEPGSVQEVSFPPVGKDMANVSATKMAQSNGPE